MGGQEKEELYISFLVLWVTKTILSIVGVWLPKTRGTLNDIEQILHEAHIKCMYAR